MVKLLGILDLLAATLLLGLASGAEVPVSVMVFVPLCIFIKGAIFIYDIGGITDVAIAVLIVLGIFSLVSPWVLFVGAAFIGIKAIESLLA